MRGHIPSAGDPGRAPLLLGFSQPA